MTATRNLTERLDRLERQNRNLKRGLGGIVLTAAALLLVGAATAPNGDVAFSTIHAQKLAIVDRDGNDRLVLELDAGEPTLTMKNHDGLQQVYLGINENWNDGAYLSVCSRQENGVIDKQAVLVATASRPASSGIPRKLLPGNSQLLLYDVAPKQENAAARHLVRLSSGRLDELKPYLEIREIEQSRDTQLSLDVLTAEPTAVGQRFLLNTTPATTSVSAVEAFK